jgi:ABC-type transport system substrate-binding protein
VNSKYKNAFFVAICFSILAMSSFVFPVAAQVYGPKSSNLIIHIYLNPDAENQDVDSGLIDINDWPLAKEWVDRWALNPDITMRSYIDIGQYEIDINHQRWPTGCEDHKYFDETCPRCVAAREFRKAISHLVDKNKIVSEVLKGFGFTMDLPVPPFQSPYLTDLEGLGLIYEYSPAMALSTLNAAGFDDWDDDDILEWKHPDTQVVEELPELVFYIRMDDPNRKAAGEMLAAELKSIGLKTKAIVTEKTVCYKQVMVLYDFHLYTGGWSLDITPDAYYDLYSNETYYGPDVGWSVNYNGFCNNEFYDYAKAAKFPSSVEEAKAAAKEAGRVYAENVAAIQMYSVAAVKAYKSSWEGVVNNAGFGIDDNIWTWLTMYNPTDDTIDYSFKSNINELNRVHSQWLWDDLALDRIYEGLMDYNPFNLDLSEYFLAESHELGTWDNPDTGEVATEINFTLRSDPQPLWHDGDPVTLEDVKFSFDFYVACGPGVCWFYPSVQDINSVDIVDGKIRVRMNLFSIWAPMWVGDLPILKEDLWGNIKDATEKTWTDPDFDFGAVTAYDPAVDDADENGVADLKQDGTGAWIFDDYELGSYVSYVANTNYYISQAEVDAALERMFHGEGDVDYDGGVGTRDIGLLLRAFLTTPATGGTPGAWGAWNPAADLNADDEVTLQDLTTAGKNFGRESG